MSKYIETPYSSPNALKARRAAVARLLVDIQFPKVIAKLAASYVGHWPDWSDGIARAMKSGVEAVARTLGPSRRWLLRMHTGGITVYTVILNEVNVVVSGTPTVIWGFLCGDTLPELDEFIARRVASDEQRAELVTDLRNDLRVRLEAGYYVGTRRSTRECGLKN
jgi:hypothetical protein